MNLRAPKMLYDHIGITEFKTKNNKKVLKLFDTNSGEVFESSSYQIVPFRLTNPSPRFAKCEEQALDFRTKMDKYFVNDEYKVFGDLEQIRTKHGESILIPLLKLTKYVKVHNVLFIPRDDLLEIFQCTNSNLNRKLNSLADRNIIQFTTKGLNKPKHVKILINPFYYYFGSSEGKMKEWLSYWCVKAESVTSRLEEAAPKKDSCNDMAIPSEDSYLYDTGYDISSFEPDSRYKLGEISNKHKQSNVDKDKKSKTKTLSQSELVYLIYGVS